MVLLCLLLFLLWVEYEKVAHPLAIHGLKIIQSHLSWYDRGNTDNKSTINTVHLGIVSISSGHRQSDVFVAFIRQEVNMSSRQKLHSLHNHIETQRNQNMLIKNEF